jgi:hypothetical protein
MADFVMSKDAMELTYMVRGADGKEYGPATLQQVTGWVREGRLQAQGPIKRSDMEQWATAGAFEEFQPLFAEAAPAPAPVVTTAQAPAQPTDALTVSQMRSGGSWFYWVAGLSLINSIAAFSGSRLRFIVGLGVTQVIDQELQGANGVALLLDLLVAGLFVLFGLFANKGHRWAFIVGMALFALDGLIFLLEREWLGVGFHVFVLYCLFRGFTACQRLAGAR